MESASLELVFDGIFGLVTLNFGSSEKFRPNGLSLVYNVFLTISFDPLWKLLGNTKISGRIGLTLV